MLFVLALAGAVEPLGAQEADPPGIEVSDLRFEGVTVFDRALLRSAIVTQRTSCKLPIPLSFFTCTMGVARDRRFFDDAELRKDLIRLRVFYFDRGYREAHVELDTLRRADGIEVVFRIDPGQPIRVTEVTVTGAHEILPEEVAAALPLRSGEAFGWGAYEASRDSLVSALRNRGYARAAVLAGYEIRAESPYRAAVSYEVIPGTPTRFGEIEVVGNRRVSDRVVERMLTFRAGDVYRQRELLRSQSNLFGLEVFRHADVQARLDEGPDSIVPVTVRVNEGDIRRIRLGAGISQAECVTAEGRWTSRNFLGGARRFEIRGAVSNVLAGTIAGFPCNRTGGGIYDELSGSLSADLTQPWFLGPRNTLGAGVYIERSSVPDVFVRNSRGAYLSVSRTLGSRTSLTLSYRPALTRLTAEGELFFCTNFVVCLEEDIRLLAEPHWLAPVNLSFSRDRSNTLFSPTRGYITRIESEYAGGVLGSDFAFVRLTGDLTTYHGIGGGVVFATHLRSGWARPTGGDERESLGLNPQRRFFAGGPNSVRGFAQYRLGPQVLKVDSDRLLMPVDSGGAGCAPVEVVARSCDANVLPAGAFDPRPVGGEVVLEGSLELRFPISREKWRGAAFVDFGQVWKTHDEIRLSELAVTPGLGIRYNSPIGPIRVDVGYNGTGGASFPVITDDLDPISGEKTGELLPLTRDVNWEPGRSFFDRLQLHFSIGQAF